MIEGVELLRDAVGVIPAVLRSFKSVGALRLPWMLASPSSLMHWMILRLGVRSSKKIAEGFLFSSLPLYVDKNRFSLLIASSIFSYSSSSFSSTSALNFSVISAACFFILSSCSSREGPGSSSRILDFLFSVFSTLFLGSRGLRATGFSLICPRRSSNKRKIR